MAKAASALNQYQAIQDSHDDTAQADRVIQVDANGNTIVPNTAKFAKIVASASGATMLVSAVTSKKIRVLSYVLVANAAVNAKFQSHVTPTDLTGLLYLGANGGVSAAYNPAGYYETVAGEALDINLSGSVAVGGHLTYIEV